MQRMLSTSDFIAAIGISESFVRLLDASFEGRASVVIGGMHSLMAALVLHEVGYMETKVDVCVIFSG